MIQLLDFSGSGDVIQLRSAEQLETRRELSDGFGCSGFGAQIRVGLWNVTKISVALFEDAGEAWLQIDNRRICLSDGRFTVARHFVAPFVRKFEVLQTNGSGRLVSFRYWYRAKNDEFPDDGDFLHYVFRSMRTRKTIAEFLCHWEFRKAQPGEISAEGLASIQECVARRLSIAR